MNFSTFVGPLAIFSECIPLNPTSLLTLSMRSFTIAYVSRAKGGAEFIGKGFGAVEGGGLDVGEKDRLREFKSDDGIAMSEY